MPQGARPCHLHPRPSSAGISWGLELTANVRAMSAPNPTQTSLGSGTLALESTHLGLKLSNPLFKLRAARPLGLPRKWVVGSRRLGQETDRLVGRDECRVHPAFWAAH